MILLDHPPRRHAFAPFAGILLLLNTCCAAADTSRDAARSTAPAAADSRETGRVPHLTPPSIVPPEPSDTVSYGHPRRPRYPPDALRMGIHGTVTLNVLIDIDGKVRETRVIQSVYPSLDEAAAKWVIRQRYVPALRDGLPYAEWLEVPVKFTIEDLDESAPTTPSSCGCPPGCLPPA